MLTNNQIKKKVLIAYKFMPQYRIDFFNLLKKNLEIQGIDLEVVYGKSINTNRNDEKSLHWAIYRKNKVIRFFGKTFYWQPIFDLIKQKDLVIVEQANSLIINYYIQLIRNFKIIKLGFWGHGRNRQGRDKTFSNYFKKIIITKCDYWFAYSISVKEYLLQNNFPSQKISVVNNTFDIVKLNKQLHSISESEKLDLRNDLLINETDLVAIYCGALYKEKRLDFLLETADLIKQICADFKLIIIGDGDYQKVVSQFAKKRDWVSYMGPQFEKDKALCFSISNIFLMPGAVGLAANDSFALETPMVLCDLDIHGPEVDYLINNQNAVFCANNTFDYAVNVVKLLQNEKELLKLKSGCIESISEFTLEKMVDKFTEGIIKCLDDNNN